VQQFRIQQTEWPAAKQVGCLAQYTEPSAPPQLFVWEATLHLLQIFHESATHVSQAATHSAIHKAALQCLMMCVACGDLTFMIWPAPMYGDKHCAV
jgi:hypothetical protein